MLAHIGHNVYHVEAMALGAAHGILEGRQPQGAAVKRECPAPLLRVACPGAPSPSLGVGIGMAYMENVMEGDTVYIKTSPRRMIEAKVKAPPFV